MLTTIELLTILSLVVIGLIVTKNTEEGFYENNIYQNAIIEEKLEKYKKQCNKPTPVLASYDITVDRRDYMEMLDNYIKGGEEMRNKLKEQTGQNSNRLTELEKVGETTLDKMNRTLDSLDLRDRAAHYFFLSKLSGAEQGL